VHAEDDSAGAAYEEIFSRRRFELAFPEAAAAGLPMLVGLDLEWKPDRGRPDNGRPGNPVALVQLACWDTALLVRTTDCTGMPTWLAECLEDACIVKVSASFDVADQAKLKSSFGWNFAERVKEPASFIDVADLAKERGLPYGLKRLSEALDAPILKRREVGCSNWATEGELNEDQRQYAAEDAVITLYLLGLILKRECPTATTGLLRQALASWRLMQEAMAEKFQRVDNMAYRRCFFELRVVVRDAVSSLCNALGSDGWTAVSNIFRVKAVDKAFKAAQKQCSIKLGIGFVRANEDLFVLSCDRSSGEPRVRLRRCGEEADSYNEKDEDEAVFVARVVDLLVAYEPPVEKRMGTANHMIMEAPWVPARAILSVRERARWEASAGRHKQYVECAQTDADGTILRLVLHPRAADSAGHLAKCAGELCEAVGLGAMEAEQRLKDDPKFAHAWSLLRTLERGSPEEFSVERSLRARTRILADAHRVGQRVAVPWEAARKAVERVRRYRRALGVLMAGSGQTDAAELADCVEAIVAAWPDMDAVALPRKRCAEEREPGSVSPDAKRARKA